MKKRGLEELNLMDDFLFQELVSRGEKGEDFCRILLTTILGKKIGKVKVTPQKPMLGRDTNLHGIRLDAYIEVMEAETDIEVESDIYDIEPNQTVEREKLPKRTRYYQGLIDSKLLGANEEYEILKNVIIIMILPYDPFGDNRMIYTVQNQCVENPKIPYNDGTKKIFLYTKGTEGNPSQELQEMLKYMESSIAENVTNESIAAIHDYVSEVKRDKEVGIQYMKSWEREKMLRETAIAEGLAEGRAKGLEEGRKEGIKEGTTQINALNVKLAEVGRVDDIVKSSSDQEYQKQLLKEFGLL